MIEIVLIRHGSTQWNEQGLYQGRTDIPLSNRGCLEVRQWNLPEILKNSKVFSSPLLRAKKTAEILFPHAEVTIDPRLIEMDFGDWEGIKVEDTKVGLDFSPPTYGWKGFQSGPPGGETYQEVLERFLSWIEEASRSQQNLVVVTHKGVILTALAQAHRWDMASKRPFKVQSHCYQVLEYSVDTGLRVKKLNQSL